MSKYGQVENLEAVVYLIQRYNPHCVDESWARDCVTTLIDMVVEAYEKERAAGNTGLVVKTARTGMAFVTLMAYQANLMPNGEYIEIRACFDPLTTVENMKVIDHAL
jgi:hypothetical protein